MTAETGALSWGRVGGTDVNISTAVSVALSGRETGNWMEGRESDEFSTLCGFVQLDFILGQKIAIDV